MVKQRAIRLLRNSGLLSRAEQVRFLLTLLSTSPRNRHFRKANPGFIAPPLDVLYDACGWLDYQQYDKSGAAGARGIADIIEALLPREGIRRVCEWGCGPGRILRHLPALLPDGVEVYGTDYNRKSIHWCRGAIPTVEFRPHALEPPLPFETEMFDCVYSVSVFTHLSEPLHRLWLDECCRVVRKGGIVVFTTHGDKFRTKLLSDERRTYDAGGFVCRAKAAEGSRLFTSFHSPDYVRRELLKGRNVVLHSELGAQDVWAMRM